MSKIPSPKELAEIHAFADLARNWRIAEAGNASDAPKEVQIGWEAEDDQRRALERAIVVFRAPSIFSLRDKLDVLIRFASTAGEDMADDERLVLEGLCALRADIIQFGG